MLHAVRTPSLACAVAVLCATGVVPVASTQDAQPKAVSQPAVPTAQREAKAKNPDRSAATVDAKTADEDPNRMICRTAPPLGTRIAKKTCKTAAEWEELRKMGNEAARTGTERGRLIREGNPGG